MLRKAGIKADPMILSTRSHGYTNAMYPLMDRFNYLVCDVEIDGKETFLDASRPGLGFGRLGYQCFNCHARVIGESARAIQLDPISVKETKNTLIFMINDDKGNYIASYQQTPGYFESFDLREEIREKGKEQVFASIRKGLGENFTASNITIDSLNMFDEPIGIKYDFEVNNNGEDIIYFNPMLAEGFKENPFKSAKRFYPVEMPYTVDETFTLQMEIPAGYVIDELPKGMVIKFNEEDDAIYEYRISTSGSSISFRSRLQIKKAYFEPDELRFSYLKE